MREGLRLVPDGTIADARVALVLQPLSTSTPGQALDRALADIGTRYGATTARVVRLELEYHQAGAHAPDSTAIDHSAARSKTASRPRFQS
jgi:hypothetical protein